MGDVPVEMFLSGPLPEGVGDVLRRLRVTEGVTRIAVMPDVHLAAEFCVGTVVATEGLLFPNAVGGDIGCGMLALRFDGGAELLADGERAARVLGLLGEACPVRRHHRRTAPEVPEELREMALGDAQLRAQSVAEEVRLQLGTLGGGNHFLELQADAEDRLWVMVHTGSRHLGQLVHHHHLAFARKLSTGIMALDAERPEGAAYFADVRVVRRWAWHNRAILARGVARVLEQVLKVTPEWESLVNIDHNHVAREVHDGREVMVHRKGATAADVDEAGLIPGSMGTRSYHARAGACGGAAIVIAWGGAVAVAHAGSRADQSGCAAAAVAWIVV